MDPSSTHPRTRFLSASRHMRGGRIRSGAGFEQYPDTSKVSSQDVRPRILRFVGLSEDTWQIGFLSPVFGDSGTKLQWPMSSPGRQHQGPFGREISNGHLQINLFKRSEAGSRPCLKEIVNRFLGVRLDGDRPSTVLGTAAALRNRWASTNP